MNRLHISAQGSWLAPLLMGALALTPLSCAEDGYDDETFSSGVMGAVLPSPTGIAVTQSADGKSQTFSWDVVMGAGGYLANLYTADGDTIVSDSVVDGCSVTMSREEDVNYIFTLQSLGNAKRNNTASTDASTFTFSTFTATYAAIPAGSDLNEWFASNPLPSDSVGTNINYDLEGGSTYTVSGLLDFGANSVTLRSNSKTTRANIQYTSETSEISTSAGLTLKYIDFDCSASTASFISMSATPAIDAIIVTAWGTDYNFYEITDNISVLNCDIKGVRNYFFWDNAVACWFPKTLIIDNCVVELTTDAAAVCSSGGYFWTNKGSGYVCDMTVSNSTFYGTGEGSAKYFYQSGGFGYSQTSTSLGWGNNTLTYDHCTFYNVCPSGQWGNYNGIAGKSTSYWNLLDCIFYNCSSGATARRFLAGKMNQATATFENNTYMKSDGTFEDPGNYDTSGTQIEEDPGFADPENGDFTISGATQIARATGDPRWIP